MCVCVSGAFSHDAISSHWSSWAILVFSSVRSAVVLLWSFLTSSKPAYMVPNTRHVTNVWRWIERNKAIWNQQKQKRRFDSIPRRSFVWLISVNQRRDLLLWSAVQLVDLVSCLFFISVHKQRKKRCCCIALCLDLCCLFLRCRHVSPRPVHPWWKTGNDYRDEF